MRPSSLLCSCLLLAACGGSTPPPNKPPPSSDNTAEGTSGAIAASDGAKPATNNPEPTAPPPAVPGKPVEVNTKETPVLRCGPKDSYVYVAKEFKCPDGTNPLGGNPQAGAAARVGNVGANSTGHIIDLYEVPCASGPQRVYVDMYGCKGGGGKGGGPNPGY
ncbi:MAG: hypothetical protein IPJ34_00770 [Myxococcales bacterium]|nr:hypothetical protein [Myxococcales bacterium]